MLIRKAEQAESRAKRDLSHYIREAVDGADLSEVESIVDDIVTAAVSRAKAEILSENSEKKESPRTMTTRADCRACHYNSQTTNLHTCAIGDPERTSE